MFPKGRVGVKMEMGIPGVQPVRGKDAVPAPPVQLSGGEIPSGVPGVPVVELVGGDLLPRAAQKVVLFCPERHIPEPGQPAVVPALTGSTSRIIQLGLLFDFKNASTTSNRLTALIFL